MIELFFLGTSAAVPTLDRHQPCIAIRWSGKIILWDVGECCQRQLMKYKVGLGSITHIFISHSHRDHYLGLYGLLDTLSMLDRKEKVFVYTPSGIDLSEYDFVEHHIIKSSMRVGLDGGYIKTFKVNHEGESFGFSFVEEDRRKFYGDKAKSLGVEGEMFREIMNKGFVYVKGRKVMLEEISYIEKGRKIVYSGDTSPSKRLIREANASTLLIHESTYDKSLREDALERRHSTAYDAGVAASESNSSVLVLTHISPRYKDVSKLVRDAEEVFDGPVIVARDGMKMSLLRKTITVSFL